MNTSDPVAAVTRAAEWIARGATPYIHGEGYYVACDVLHEPEDPGLFFNGDDNNAHTRLTTLAFVLAVLHSHGK